VKLKLILLFILLTGFAYGQKHQKPNIVFCLADDWGWLHAGAYGDEDCKKKLEKLNDPRAKDPNYDQFYNEPYLGMSGAKKHPSKKD
jgi:hypothetical protein